MSNGILHLHLDLTDSEIDQLARGELRDNPRKPWTQPEKRRLARRALMRILKSHAPIEIRGTE